MKIVVNILLAVVMIFPLVLVGSGLWLLGQRQFGEKVEAEVLNCDIDIGYKASKQYCTARWTQDGVVHFGPIQGSSDSEVGDTVTATIRGDELYSRSLGLPLILLGLGLPFCVLPYSFVRRKLRRT